MTREPITQASAPVGPRRARPRNVLLLLLFAALLLGPAAIDGAAGAPSTAHLAAASKRANLWVGGRGGQCSRSIRVVSYRPAAACRSLAAAWAACRPGDHIIVKAGSYGRQQVDGDKAAPGCVFTGTRGTRFADLSTTGDFFTLRQATIDVGNAKRAGWEASGRHITLRNVRLRGPFVSVDIHDASDVKWIRGELGVRGRKGGRRVCGEDAEPVQIENADHVLVDGIDFHPQDADPSPSSCSANGFHLEMIRLDYGTSYFTLRDSTLDNGDASDTASIFITEPGGDADPQHLRFENNFFGTNASVNGAFDTHGNVTTCRSFTFAYNTFRAPTGTFQCSSTVDTRWIGNLGANGPSSPCVGSYVRNVWQDPRRDHCGSDTWVVGPRNRVDRLGLGGPGGFYLTRHSPGVNAGELSYCTTLLGRRDHDGGRRPVGRRCDAGADERR